MAAKRTGPVLGSSAPSLRHDPRLETYVSRAAPLLRPATLNDAPRLHHIAECLALGRLQRHKVPLDRTGFLVSAFSADDYEAWAQRADHFLVLQVEGSVVGFVLAYSSERVDRAKEELNAHILDALCPRFVLIKQICVHPEHAGRGYAQRLYRELFARVAHFDAASRTPGKPRPMYAAIVERPPNPRSVRFHEGMGFSRAKDYTPADGTPRHIYCNPAPLATLERLCAQPAAAPALSPLYDALAMADPDAVGVGIALYHLDPPDEKGSFRTEVRVMLKWRHPPLLETSPRVEGASRTPLDVDGPIRAPRYATNALDVDTTQKYAYIDRHDPPDVATMQVVLKGTFQCRMDLRAFPADVQSLPFRHRMWDSDPDDRRRYFRQLCHADGTPWPVGVKGDIESIECVFQAPRCQVGLDPVATTSFLEVSVASVRRTGFYLRTVAVPLATISALVITSAAIPAEDYGARAGQNTGLLLTAVAFLLIGNEGLPRAAYMTQLDKITAGCFMVIWSMLIAHFVGNLLEIDRELDLIITFCLGGGMLSYVAYKLVGLEVTYRSAVATRPPLGSAAVGAQPA